MQCSDKLELVTLYFVASRLILLVSIITVIDYYQGQARCEGRLSYWIEGDDWWGFIIFMGQEHNPMI